MFNPQVQSAGLMATPSNLQDPSGEPSKSKVSDFLTHLHFRVLRPFAFSLSMYSIMQNAKGLGTLKCK